MILITSDYIKSSISSFVSRATFLALIVCTTQSHAIILEDVLDARRAIVQHESKSESAIAVVKQNNVRIEGLKDKISEVDESLSDVKKDIAKNEKGMSEFPEFASNFQPKIAALIKTKAKLITQRKNYNKGINKFEDEISDLEIQAEENNIDANKQSRRLKKLKQSYLDKQVSEAIEKAESGQAVIETQQLTCSFLDIYGKHNGDRQVCLTRAIEQAKRSAADKYSPTSITSEIETRNFEITSESSSQYYAVDVRIKKEFKDDSWIKMEADAERFRAQFKGQIKISPTFTKKMRQKLMERYAVKLSGEIGQVAATEKRKTIVAAKKRIEREERERIQSQHSDDALLALKREIELLKQANSARQIEQQQQAAALAARQVDLNKQSEEARIQAEVARRIQAETKILDKQATKIAKEEERDVFVPPVF